MRGNNIRQVIRSPTLDAVLPNAGLEAHYQARLMAIVNDLDFTTTHEITRVYSANAAEIAMDAAPVDEIKAVFKRIVGYWEKKLNRLAPETAKAFTKEALSTSDRSFMGALRKAGFTIKFQMTETMLTAYAAEVEQNVGLIKSIGSEYLSDVQGEVMRSVAAGRDLGTLTQTLKKRYEITQRRAALIATHQNNLATATFNRVRALEAGFTKGIWRHSAGGNYPRKSHIAADGEEFDIAQGCYIDGEYIHPMQKLGCKCFFRSVIPGLPPRPMKRAVDLIAPGLTLS